MFILFKLSSGRIICRAGNVLVVLPATVRLHGASAGEEEGARGADCVARLNGPVVPARVDGAVGHEREGVVQGELVSWSRQVRNSGNDQGPLPCWCPEENSLTKFNFSKKTRIKFTLGPAG